MLNEEVSKETVDAGKQAGKAVFRKAIQIDAKGLSLLIRLMKTAPKKVMEKLNEPGKEMSVKELLKKGEGTQSIDISDIGIGDFKPIARRYGMDFAIVKSRYLDPPKYTVFLKAKDVDTVETFMNEYSAKCMRQKKEEKTEIEKERPSLLAMLKKLKAITVSNSEKAVEKKKKVVR